MLESQQVPELTAQDVPSLDTTFTSVQPVRIAFSDSEMVTLSAEAFGAMMSGAPVEVVHTEASESHAFRIQMPADQTGRVELVPRLLPDNPAGIIALAAMAALVIRRRVDQYLHPQR